MKGLANSVGVATAIVLGLQPGATALPLGQELANLGQELADNDNNNNRPTGSTQHGVGSRSSDMKTLGIMPPRRLQATDGVAIPTDTDDALDINGSPEERAFNALTQRQILAETEYTASHETLHFNNGDRSSAGTFHKTLPHDEFGQVDSFAFDALEECIATGSYDLCEEVPSGDADGYLVQPLGGIAVDMAGPASSAVTVPSAPALDSEDFAAQLAEVYWMSLVRDVPFSQYGEDNTTVAAADNLAAMPGFANMSGVAVGLDGRADPQSQLFRSSAMGVQTGPFISQLLVKDFSMDSMTISPQQTTLAPGVDYMTDYDEWLRIQNGGSIASPDEEDSVKRYIRNARDLARLVATDTIYTEAFRGALVLFQEGAISKAGFNGPYEDSSRQKGFVSFGVSHVMKIVASAETAQRSSWYQKWNVHLFARPEATAGTLHNVIYGHLDVAFHESLRGNEELLERVAAKNADLNGGVATYLLSQAVSDGSPAHPSYPAGHAVQNGAFATILKAFVGLERGASCFSDPVYPDDEGLTLLPYTGSDCLTYEGEINKMAVNIALGRQMCGVHYRFDSEEGLILGEIIGVRMLQQEIMTFPEQHGYEFRLMAGETIRVEPDGTFYIDGFQCSGAAFLGVDACLN